MRFCFRHLLLRLRDICTVQEFLGHYFGKCTGTTFDETIICRILSWKRIVIKSIHVHLELHAYLQYFWNFVKGGIFQPGYL